MPTAEEYKRMMQEWYRSQQEEEKSPIERYYEAGRQVPTPSVISAPTPAIIEYQRTERGRTPIEQYYSAGRGVTTPPIREYYYSGRQLPSVRQPATPALPYREPSASTGWQLPTTYPRASTQMPYEPIASYGWQGVLPEVPTSNIFYSPAELRASTGWQYPRELIQGMFGGRPSPSRALEAESRGLSVDWAGLWRNYLDIYKRLYQGPTFDFTVSGPTEDLYAPEDYAPDYGTAEAPTYTIRYGGGGTPSGQRNYASNLINWRV